MRLALTSDLHVDHHPEVIPLVCARVRELAVDVFIVAGDVTHDLDTLEAALAQLGKAAPRTVFVPGNHDIWCRADRPGPTSRDKYERDIPERCARAGVAALHAAPVDIGGVVFCGTTGWYDYSLRSKELDGTFSREDYVRGAWGRLRWNDKLRVTWPDDAGGRLDDLAICDNMVRALERQLDDAGARPTVVVTHHLPLAALVTSRGEPPWDFINGFMGSERLGAAMQRAGNVRFGAAGHTHFRKRAVAVGPRGEFPVETSPVGYPREYARYAGLTLAERVLDRVSAIELI
ncbi:MAG TPA: metallophosphoesterase [Polyangia bacterium]|jgi:putative phosphoesterase|nr:metallophosphoesterase [Polyangia bacterium]